MLRIDPWRNGDPLTAIGAFGYPLDRRNHFAAIIGSELHLLVFDGHPHSVALLAHFPSSALPL